MLIAIIIVSILDNETFKFDFVLQAKGNNIITGKKYLPWIPSTVLWAIEKYWAVHWTYIAVEIKPIINIAINKVKHLSKDLKSLLLSDKNNVIATIIT